ncbi:hypothetical protein T265_08365 [Opisthorchis viverrini]|uniref:Trematode PH-like domain-containing protein n=1 Tax=Opisthorchis viverrini TaxID=6198 RepID=A0A075A8K5_OPIVI|nr:hypothetical protein T265_08365 [Opisthorchis viverrini]KER23819.1 hypothetical protein T265_08365 [Opisthorchis viverrini]
MSRKGTSKKSSKTDPPRGSHMVDGYLVHTDTRQRLFYYVCVYTVFRKTLEAGEQLGPEEAIAVMKKHIRKRVARCVCFMLEDRLIFEKHKPKGKEPFRSWIAYEEIQDINRSPRKREVFVLSIITNREDHRYYEVYRCNKKDEAAQVEHYIQTALQDPGYRIHCGTPIDIVTVPEYQEKRRTIEGVCLENVSEGETSNEEELKGGQYHASVNGLRNSNITNHMYMNSNMWPGDEACVTSGDSLPVSTQNESHSSGATTPPTVFISRESAIQWENTPVRRHFLLESGPISATSPEFSNLRSVCELEDVTFVDVKSSSNDHGPVYLYLKRKPRWYE